MNLLWKCIRPFYLFWCITWFLLFMVLVFPCVLFLALWGKLKGGNMMYKLLFFWADCWFFLSAIRVPRIDEVPHDPSKQYIFIANHISYLDAAMVVKVIRQPFRALGKIELKDIPIFGLIYRIAVVVVDRSDAEHRKKSVENLLSLIRKGISIFIFPEGTFNDTPHPMGRCYDGAFRIALETGIPIKPVLFPDTFSRMPPNPLFSLNPGTSRAIFLEEISTEGWSLEDIPAFKEHVISVMSAKLLEYTASWIRLNDQAS